MSISRTHLFFLALTVVVSILSPPGRSEPFMPGSVAVDSLLYPGEVYVITSAELTEYNINSLYDILEILPGVSSWRNGPAGSEEHFSVDGFSARGITLLLNGVPFTDPYDAEALSRFLPLSRLKQVEVIYSRSPLLTGVASSGSVINIVMEEGGREGPYSAVDFTHGSRNRRSRRIWFSSPRAYINAALVYDEYLQDARRVLPANEMALLGQYDSRSVLFELNLVTERKDEITLRLHRYEDTYWGTSFRPYRRDIFSVPEDVRYKGFDSFLRYRKNDLTAYYQLRVVEMKRASGWTSGQINRAALNWKGRRGNYSLRAFFSAEKGYFQNLLWGNWFDPEYGNLEGGFYLGGGKANTLVWRCGFTGGFHDQCGAYGGGEGMLTRGRPDRFYQSLIISRRSRIPTVAELFQPQMDRTIEGLNVRTGGNSGLDAEQFDDLTLEAGFWGRLAVSLFARKERSLIALSGSNPALYASRTGGEVTGARGRFTGQGEFLGTAYNYALNLEYFGKRSDSTPGVPEYRALGRCCFRRRVFKQTETLALHLDIMETGSRNFGDVELKNYQVVNAAASLTVLSMVISFEYRNLFDIQYQTVPGILMPERHFRIGLTSDIFD
ncbi:MAG: TonB-dependent receptor plug domain-containing protein [Candidatus Krumholzibacteriota bacterium]|nr:TonB-dependent receptor plug domain-containing protein [Candidatus Krumholzibacteriota bacterium]